MEFLVLQVEGNSSLDRTSLTSRLNEGWEILRCDALRPGGNSYSSGTLVYVLRRSK
jgi:hypothetical protein